MPLVSFSNIEKSKSEREAEKSVMNVLVSFSNSGTLVNIILMIMKKIDNIHPWITINVSTSLSILMMISIIGPKVLDTFKIKKALIE